MTVQTVSGATVTIDPLDFFRRTKPEQTLQGFVRGPAEKPEDQWKSEYGEQSFVEPYEGRFYYVKNAEDRDGDGVFDTRQYERFQWHRGRLFNSIALERDTGWGGPASSFDSLPFGSREYIRWPFIGASDGKVASYKTDITGWDDGRKPPQIPCTYRSDIQPYNQEMYLQYYPAGKKDFGGDLGAPEAISITQYDINPRKEIETFWYARGYGWVEWNNHDVKPGQDPQTVDDNDVRWNRWEGVVKEPQRPREPNTSPCPPFMQYDLYPQPADVSEYFFLEHPFSSAQLIAGPPAVWAAGQTRTYTVKVKNMGTQTWEAGGANAVRLGVHFGTASDDPEDGWTTNQTFSLPENVPSGKSTYVEVKVTAPDQPGTYTLRHRLVRGNNNWFEQIHKTQAMVIELPPPPPIIGNIRASVGAAGEGNGMSYQASLSADKSRVAFASGASNLVPGDTNNDWDVFVRDLTTRQTTRVSIGTGGEANGSSTEPSISADGNRVAFASEASNLVPGDTNNESDIFVYDLTTGTTTRVSVATRDDPGGGFAPSISANGNRVAFDSRAFNLVPGDRNNTSDIFVYDLTTNRTTRVSIGTEGEANGESIEPSISADGSRVAFSSWASNLVSFDPNNTKDVFVYDLTTNGTTWVSVGANKQSWLPSISANGDQVAFSSLASNLAPGDNNNVYDVFVRDLLNSKTSRASIGIQNEANSSSYRPSISADGTRVAFESYASNLVLDDNNNTFDVFVAWTRP